MGVVIIFRRDAQHSLFRDYLHMLVSIADKRVYLTSGYFSQSIYPTKYQLSNDELIETIKNSVCPKIYIGGCMGSSIADRNRFIYEINKVLPMGRRAAGLVQKSNWHAKIALAVVKDSGPVCAIIGSSNLTRSAYGENPNSFNPTLNSINGASRFNHECDVVIWDNDNAQVNEIAKSILNKNHSDNISDRIFFEKIPESLLNRSEKKLLEDIEKLMPPPDEIV